jgi:mRNA-degrading endonuclease toxin of MazEF toxin-antitoxin module
VKRGEVWWATLPPPANRRPVLLLSRDSAYRQRTHCIVTPLTRTIRHLRSEVRLGPQDGVRFESVVNLDDIITIPLSDLQEQMNELSPAKMDAVRDAIIYALSL